MTEEQAFLADICEHPGDDAPRLIYADWLDEHGRPEWAEFVRAQCELARPDVERDDVTSLLALGATGTATRAWAVASRRLALYRRERELLEVHGGRWATQAGVDFSSASCVFRRGFVAAVSLPCADFLRHGPALVRAAPLEGVRLSDKRPEVGRAGVASWRFVDNLRLREPWELPSCFNGGWPVWLNCNDEGAATKFLSERCMAWARRRRVEE